MALLNSGALLNPPAATSGPGAGRQGTPAATPGAPGSSQPTMQQLTPVNPGSIGGTVTNATTGTVGTATSASASTTGPLADISSGNMNPNDSTNAASQLDAITRDNSPYIQQATQQGLLTAASRGLQNSSLGAGAAEAAAVQAAAPLAEQNASSATAGRLQNSQLLTQASEFNAGQQNANQQLQAQLDTQGSQFNAGQNTQNSQFNAQSANAMAAQTQQLTEQLNQQFLSGTQAQQLAGIQGQWNSFIQQNTSASQLYQQTLSSLGAILNNKDIDPTRAAADIKILLDNIQGALGVMNTLEGGSGSTGGSTGGGGTGGGGTPGVALPPTSTVPQVPGAAPINPVAGTRVGVGGGAPGYVPPTSPARGGGSTGGGRVGRPP